MATDRRAILFGSDPLALRGLRDYLSAVPDLAVVAELTEPRAVRSALRTHRPHFLFFVHPERFPNAGLDLARVMRESCRAVRLIVVTRPEQVDLVFAYAELGVAAYFVDTNPRYLVEDLRTVQAGQAILDRELAGRFGRFLQTPLGQAALRTARVAPPAVGDGRRRNGSRREAVVWLAAAGLTNREIGEKLRIAESTVPEHLERHRARVGPTRRVLLGRTLTGTNCAG